MEPWNFPDYQPARVAGPQLMVGNVVVCKHAGLTPQCAQASDDIFREAGAPAIPSVATNPIGIGSTIAVDGGGAIAFRGASS